ncbi:hypothetical protein HID58_085837 [Brassica napus]|uniref:Uncharacterized protein n=2 Tax=Brassica TaxID=3705 RepID=A0A3P6E0H9_BRAOL|nr:hypothetical protein HID58_085837 [Brassica napus]CAF1724004.1 unnamed protein product [Brassica napus]VDD29691.1 unnamed protein product [Brassica oleracea]
MVTNVAMSSSSPKEEDCVVAVKFLGPQTSKRQALNLKELPDLSTATNLQELNLFGCSSLTELPFSIGNAINLWHLDLRDCSSLVEFPSSMENVTTLEELLLTGCSHLANLPPSIGNLKTLYLENCSSLVELLSSDFFSSGCSNLVELPLYIPASYLKKFELRGCSSLRELPSSIGNMTNLEELYLGGCSSLVEFPSSIGNMTNLRNLFSLRRFPQTSEF